MTHPVSRVSGFRNHFSGGIFPRPHRMEKDSNGGNSLAAAPTTEKARKMNDEKAQLLDEDNKDIQLYVLEPQSDFPHNPFHEKHDAEWWEKVRVNFTKLLACKKQLKVLQDSKLNKSLKHE